MKRVGVTGNIAAGKSFVCKVLNEVKNIPVFNCDIEARKLILNDDWVIEHYRKIFDKDPYIYEYGVIIDIDRQYVANEIFNNKEKLIKVNRLVEGPLYAEICKFFYNEEYCKSVPAPFVLIEAANMIESRLVKMSDCIIYVDAPIEIREERAIQRGMNKEDFYLRNKFQTDYAKNTDVFYKLDIPLVIFKNYGNSKIEDLYLALIDGTLN